MNHVVNALLTFWLPGVLLAQEPDPAAETTERRGPSTRLWHDRSRFRERTGPGAIHARFFATVDSALNWLARRQEDDGSWPQRTDESDRTTTSNLTYVFESSAEARFGVTGLAVLAILGDGRSPPDSAHGLHASTLHAGLRWLMEHVDEVSNLTACADRAWGVLALVDAAAHSEDPQLRAAAQRGCRLLAEGPWDTSDRRSWEGACASVLVLTIAWHADLDVDDLTDAALARSAELSRTAPGADRSVPLLYLANLIRPDPLPDPQTLPRYFDALAEAARIPVLGEIEESVLFDVWHHLACVSIRGSSVYRGPFAFKRSWQLVETQDRSGAFSSSLASAERRTAQAVLIIVNPYSLLGFNRGPTGRR